MTTQTVTLRLVADNDQLVGEVRGGRRELDRFGRDAQRAGSTANRSFAQASEGARRTHDQFRALRNQVIGVLGAFTGIQAARGITNLADNYTQLQNRIRTVTESQREQVSVTEDLLRVAQQTRSSFGATVEVYARTALSAQELNANQQDLIDFARTLNEAAVLSGASAQEASAAMIQLSQGLASGELRGEELRSVLEQLPVVADLIAQQMGATRGELLEFGEAGEISAQIVLDAFRNAREEISERFLETVPTLGQAMDQLRNGLTAYIGVSNESAGATAGLSEFIGDLGGVLTRVATEANGAAADLTDSNRDVIDWSDTLLLILASTVDGVRSGFATLKTLFGGAGLTVAAGASQAVALLRGDIDLARQIGNLWQEDLKSLGSDLANFDASQFRDALADIQIGSNGVRGEFLTIGEELDRLEGEFRGSSRGARESAEEIAQLNRQLELMQSGLSAADAAAQAQRETLEGSELVAFDLQQRIEALATAQREAATAAEEQARAEAEAAEERAQTLDRLRDAALSPGDRAREAFEQQLEDLNALLADGLPLDEYFTISDGLIERFGEQLADGLGDATDEVRRQFERRFGEGLSDGLLDSLQEIESVRNALGDIDAPFSRSIDRMLAGLQQFTAAGEAAAGAQFGMYAAGVSQMLNGAQQLASEGSAAYDILGTAAAAAAVASAAAAPWPANLAAIPAMIGLMQSLGFGVGGDGFSGGALDTDRSSGVRSSGTVLGEPGEGSESVSNSLDRLSEIADRQLGLTGQMAQSLSNIESALAGVTSDFARIAGERGVQNLTLSGRIGNASAEVGGFQGSIEAYISSVLLGEDALLQSQQERFSQRAAEASADITQGVQDVFDNLGAGVQTAVTALGGDAEAALRVFEGIELPDLRIGEQEDLDQALQSFFSAIGDSAIEVVSGATDLALEEFQRYGEGALETLTRIAANVEVAQSVIDRVGSSLEASSIRGGGLSPVTGRVSSTEQLARISTALVEAAGGLEELSSASQSFVDDFLSDSEQLNIARREAASAIEQLGFQLPATRDGFRDLVQSFEVTDEASARTYAQLLQLAPALDEVFSASEQIAEEQTDLQIRLLQAQGRETAALALERERELDAVSESNRALLESVFAAEDAAAAQRELEQAQQAASRAARDATRSLAVQIAELRGQSVAGVRLDNVLTDIGNAGSPQDLLEQFGSLQNALTAQLNEQLDTIQQQQQATGQQSDAIRGQISALNEQISAAERLRDIAASIRDYVTGLDVGRFAAGTPLQQLEAAQQRFFQLTNAARGGDVEAARAVQGQASEVLGLAQDIFASGGEFQAIRQTIIDSLNATAGAVDVSTPELQALENQLSVLEQIRDNQPTQVSGINSAAAQQQEATREALADKLENLSDIASLIEQATLLPDDAQVDALATLREAMVTAINGGNLDNVEGLNTLRDKLEDLESVAGAGLGNLASLTNAELARLNDIRQSADFQRLGIDSLNNLTDAELQRIIQVVDNTDETASGTAALEGALFGLQAATLGATFATNGHLSAIRNALNAQNDADGLPQYAMGGIASGPRSGYPVELHGTEAIMPTVRMPDGNFGVRVDNHNGDVVRELRENNRQLREQNAHLEALVRVEQSGWKSSLEQGEQVRRNTGESARRARMESAA